jgi:hypothetical protein
MGSLYPLLLLLLLLLTYMWISVDTKVQSVLQRYFHDTKLFQVRRYASPMILVNKAVTNVNPPMFLLF